MKFGRVFSTLRIIRSQQGGHAYEWIHQEIRARLLLALCLIAATTTAAWAQSGLATVTGIVTDAQGAAVPGVMVTATNTATNVPYTGVSNEAGVYTINALPIGAYQVKVELQGFKAVTVNASLSAGQTARIDAALEVGISRSRSR